MIILKKYDKLLKLNYQIVGLDIASQYDTYHDTEVTIWHLSWYRGHNTIHIKIHVCKNPKYYYIFSLSFAGGWEFSLMTAQRHVLCKVAWPMLLPIAFTVHCTLYQQRVYHDILPYRYYEHSPGVYLFYFHL